jgi:23S rRNA-/tRNA-specific pseudouridylate synthase
VKGSPKPRKGRIESRLAERADGSVHSTKQHAAGERAVTEYEVVDEADGCATLHVTLRTGRKHQIRVHLSERGWPIVGDTVYGSADRGGLKLGGLKLRAVRLAFDHPRTGQRMTFSALNVPV